MRAARRRRATGVVLLLVVLAGLALWRLNRLDEDPLPPRGAAAFVPSDAQRARGAYLALAGNCAGCHTAPGGAAYAGGAAIDTPFGRVFPGNLTPHAAGLGGWSAAHFWRALHNGRSRDGRLLYPAFPYPHFSRVTREDSDALFAYLSSLPSDPTPSPAHQLRFPYDQPLALAVWRALFFRPGIHRPDPARPAEWNRGAYLVAGLAHCGACHSPRNALGATPEGDPLTGAAMPQQGWYAPSLRSAAEAGVAHWTQQDAVALLRDGTAAGASVQGPMAEVVFRSTRHLAPADLEAVATYLRDLPPLPGAAPAVPAPPPPRPPATALLDQGGRLYARHCADCHGAQGQGGQGYPALAGNRGVQMQDPSNLLRMVLHGGFAPVTAGNPRPLGMPPFFQQLDDAEVAAVATYVRNAWGNRAGAVAPVQALRVR